MGINLMDGLFRVANVVHPGIVRLSRSRIGGRVVGVPVIMLTTTGRKTGKPRVVPLLAIEHEGHTYVVASKGGDDRHPVWYLNLVDNPRVTVQRDGREERMVARVLTAEEKAGVWPAVTRTFKGYAGYQKKTAREIPVVELVPAEG